MQNPFFPGGSNYYPASINPSPLIQGASNVKEGENPSFTADDFLAFYRQFEGQLDSFVLDQFVAMAHACVQEARWHESWHLGMCLYIAHFATLFLETMTGNNPSAEEVVSAARVRGLQTSKSVGDVSVSYDFGHIQNDLKGWAAWDLTSFGAQFATLARMLGKAGMYVY
jgi:hypothetical protein